MHCILVLTMLAFYLSAFLLTSAAVAAADVCPQPRRFKLWRAGRCPSVTSQLQVAAFAKQWADANSVSHCLLLCRRTAGCRAVCLHPAASVDGSAHYECHLFRWETFAQESDQLNVSCSDDYGSGCFVEFPVLIAVRNCSQSSVDYNGYCERAIDKNFEQNYYKHARTHTLSEVNRWWRVSFAFKSLVSSVTIYNRQDQNAERLDNFNIAVDKQVCSSFALNGSAPFSVRNFPCNRIGVSLQISSRPLGILTLCEVQIWGFAAPN